MDAQELKSILELHKKWINGKSDGKRADLRGANLHGADLRDADLHGADLRDANLHGANLYDADLRDANLRDADLHGADLRDADLHGANLHGANLYDANLRDADLHGADLHGANLHGADLHGADLHCANLHGANLHGADLHGADLLGADLRDADLLDAKNIPDIVISLTTILPDGDIIGFKKCDNGVISKFLIPSNSKRSNATGRKCRTQFVKVLENFGGEVGITESHGPRTEYKVGEIVWADSFDKNRWNECSHGIHFFITRLEAENYNN